MHHLKPRESFPPGSLGRRRAKGVPSLGFWVLQFGLGTEECGCGREAAMAVLKRPNFDPGMCRKPSLGKCQVMSGNKKKSQLKKR